MCIVHARAHAHVQQVCVHVHAADRKGKVERSIATELLQRYVDVRPSAGGAVQQVDLCARGWPAAVTATQHWVRGNDVQHASSPVWLGGVGGLVTW